MNAKDKKGEKKKGIFKIPTLAEQLSEMKKAVKKITAENLPSEEKKEEDKKQS